MKRRQLLARIVSGAVQNIAIADFQSLLVGFGFVLRRISGSHHIYSHPAIPELVNLQQVEGQAKPYQIRQVMRLVERYNLALEDES